MKLRLLSVALLTAAACAAPPLEPPPPVPPAVAAPPAASAAAPAPPAGIRLDRAVMPVRHRATLTVVPGDPVLAGEIEIELALRAETGVLWLNATEITVDEAHVEAGGKRIAARVLPGGEDLVGFALAEEAPAGAARLFVRYRGAISAKNDRGVFLEEDLGKRYVFTQFESIEARKAFPCFDEPSFKAPWQLTLKIKGDDVALSNTPVASESAGEGGVRVVRFAETKPLPAYLVAFAVGPFEMVDAGKAGKNGTPVRVAVPRGKAAEARWAVETTPALLGLLEDYFGIPYPYEKLDVAPIPRLASFGAMENAGLVTIRASRALASGAEETAEFKRDYAEIMAHELAHQWFGDLVTTDFWDDIWLNEAFAEWMGSKIVEKWKPEWREDASRAGATAWAMRGDELATARKIRQEIRTKDDIQNAFDAITYDKGSAVIAMFEAWAGEERFRKGVRRYLEAHAHGNARSADFLAAIGAEVGEELAPAFLTFLDQPGVPAVSAEIACEAGKPPRVSLSQRRFLPAGSKGSSGETWRIPVCARTPAAGDAGRACALLDGPKGELPLAAGAPCPEWLLLHRDGVGYYRAAYGPKALSALLGAWKRLTEVERLAVIRDVGARAQAGDLPIAEALSLVPDLAKDPSPHVLRALVGLVSQVREALVPEEARPAFARFVVKAFGKKARELGLRPRAGEDDETRLLRPLVVTLVANRGEDAALIAEARKLAGRWLEDPASLEPDAVEAVLAIAAAHGDRALFDRLHAEVKKATDQKRRSRIVRALSSFRDPALIRDSLAIFLTDELDARESLFLLFRQQEERAAPVVFAFLKERFDAIAARTPDELRGDLPWAGTGFCDEGRRAEVEALFKDKVGALTGGPRNLAQVLEEISLCSARRGAQREGLLAFLKNR
ncbi:MAG: ERAP1-like C-terminal domain-containing protein [Polyangiaceae bacterium]|nr:ERAP1-like C-terminal domain-containing protein [Polyangiaceae bacterium]